MNGLITPIAVTLIATAAIALASRRRVGPIEAIRALPIRPNRRRGGA